ncbi:MAG: tetratricopeptide repeat protein [Lachnospiraceae bacterium]|nr:tetratricopeptide repeat protein [Lachnospiraceae bacterium]
MKKHRTCAPAIPVLCMGILLTLTGCGKQTGEYTQAGMNSVMSMEYSAALDSFDQALLNGEEERQILRGKGLAYMGQAAYEDAADAFEQALFGSDMIPDAVDVDINYYLATCYYRLGDAQKALAVYDAILNRSRKETAAWYERGIVELEVEQYDKAIADFEKAMELAPADYDMLVRIYEALEEKGYGEQGRVYLEQALESGTGNMADYDRGRISYYMGDYVTARNKLEESRSTGGQDACFYLGKSWEALGDYNYAASVYNSYLAEHGPDAKIYNQLALCKLQLGNYQEALEAIRGGLSLEDSGMEQTLCYNQIVIYEYLEDYDQALVLCRNFLQKYPTDTQAQAEYLFLNR